MTLLHLAYWANILILLPIALPTLLRLYPTDQGKFVESAGWRSLVGSLWTAILVLSVLGLFDPLRYAPVLLLQWIYKSLWLAVHAAPRLWRREWAAVPWGITLSFAVLVLVWTFIIPWGVLFRPAAAAHP